MSHHTNLLSQFLNHRRAKRKKLNPADSGLSFLETAVKPSKKVAHAFLCKPFNDRQINEALEEVLSEA